ncbi:hypothetical protein [Paenibacillus sp. GCM10023250]|uniref:hypothetical protein n=1 Tax=Paenibacillus sp. GCM10023250 TaxID=3252648 RepID=UPI0036138689
MTTISWCPIVKNEEDVLAHLDSVKTAADDIAAVATGSAAAAASTASRDRRIRERRIRGRRKGGAFGPRARVRYGAEARKEVAR